jgi:hypothetical protein
MSNTTNEKTAYTNDKEFEAVFEAFLEHPFKDLYQDTMLLNSMREAAEFGRKYALQLSAHCQEKDKWVKYTACNHPENHSAMQLVILDTGEYDIAYWDDKLEWMIDGNSHQHVEYYRPLPQPPNT